MTGEFSRRSFLKYTALTAVAVAGSSLLTGCGSYSAMKTTVPSSNTVLKVVTKLEQVEVEYDAANTTTIFKLTVTNGPDSILPLNALQVNAENFAVTADRYLAAAGQNLRVTSPDAVNQQVKEGETRTFYVHAEGLKALEKEEVTLTFYPRPQKYSGFNANWVLSKDVLKDAISTPSRT